MPRASLWTLHLAIPFSLRLLWVRFLQLEPNESNAVRFIEHFPCAVTALRVSYALTDGSWVGHFTSWRLRVLVSNMGIMI